MSSRFIDFSIKCAIIKIYMNSNQDKNFIDILLCRKSAFTVVFFAVFTMSYGTLFVLDCLPEMVVLQEEKESSLITETTNTIETEPTTTDINITEPVVTEPILPVHPNVITFPTLDKTVSVLNPSSRNVIDLDNALLEGVVRHPDSATMEQKGTVFLLGHSSYLPSVRNKNFQAFNGIQNLKWGDEIEVGSESKIYIYRVEKVYRAKAQDVTVPIAGDVQRLVLATCNSLGSTDDRYIVEAELIVVK